MVNSGFYTELIVSVLLLIIAIVLLVLAFKKAKGKKRIGVVVVCGLLLAVVVHLSFDLFLGTMLSGASDKAKVDIARTLWVSEYTTSDDIDVLGFSKSLSIQENGKDSKYVYYCEVITSAPDEGYVGIQYIRIEKNGELFKEAGTKPVFT